MIYDKEALLRLLPELYAVVDGPTGLVSPDHQALRALLQVLAEQAQSVNENIGQLYADEFIETCAEWVVPYIGDLVGVRGLHMFPGATFSQRGWVANTLGYRRRKGTLSMLRQLARDVTGYEAAAVEMFQRLDWTQNVNHVRLQNPRTPDLRDANALELLEGAFTKGTFTPDVRRIDVPRGKYNIPNIGIFLWRLQAFPLTGVVAKAGPVAGSYTFSPLGIDAPIFNEPDVDPSQTVIAPATEVNVPDVLRRRALHDDLEAVRLAAVRGTTHASPYVGDNPVLLIRVRGEANPVPASEIFVCNLENWGKVPTVRTYTDANGAAVNRPIRVGVDPLRGRLRFVVGQEPASDVLVDYSYGFSSAMGAGPYDRTRRTEAILPKNPDWYRVVQKAPAGAAPFVVATLQQAILDWNAEGAGKHGIIAIVDSETYVSATLRIDIPEASELCIVAGEWPLPAIVANPRDYSTLSANVVRPHVNADIEVTGSAPNASQAPGSLRMSSLLIEGRLSVQPGHLGGLSVFDTTLVPVGTSILARSGAAGTNHALELSVDHSIVGNVEVRSPSPNVTVRDSIVGGFLQALLSEVRVERSTILAVVSVEQIEGSDSIFLGVITATRAQVGCMRFSFFPDGSKVPKAYRCQPVLAIHAAVNETEAHIRARMTPSFVSTRYGEPGYMQLAATTSREILIGASNGDEMGAFNAELHSLREANLRCALTEYLRVGLEAGIFYSN